MSEQEDIKATPTEQEGMDRRQLLARLGATGLVGAGLLVSGEWRKPVVLAANLPPHAQISPVPTSTSTPTATPTPTPVVHTFVSCDWIGGPSATVATINPPDPNISLSVQVYDSATDAPIPGDSGTYLTAVSGRAQHTSTSWCVDYPIIYAVWSFTYPAEGTGTCTTADYVVPC